MTTRIKLSQADKEEVIARVADNHKHKTFDVHDQDDIIQQVWLIALSIIDDFEPSKGKVVDVKKSLEHWLNASISNRLSNFYRDKYLVPQRMMPNKSDVKPHNLLSALDIDIVRDTIKFNCNAKSMENEIWCAIFTGLDPVNLDILESLMSGEIINCYYKNKLISSINLILEEKWPKISLSGL